jgi:hypothetical protein
VKYLFLAGTAPELDFFCASVSNKSQHSFKSQRNSNITCSVQVSRFFLITSALGGIRTLHVQCRFPIFSRDYSLKNKGEPFRIPKVSQKWLTLEPLITSALGGIRTPKNGSEDRCDIHFTTRAIYEYNTLISLFINTLLQ